MCTTCRIWTCANLARDLQLGVGNRYQGFYSPYYNDSHVSSGRVSVLQTVSVGALLGFGPQLHVCWPAKQHCALAQWPNTGGH